MYQLRTATIFDAEFLADVVVEATRAQGRLSPDFDERKFRVDFTAWTAEQITDAEGESTTYVIEVNGERIGRLRVVRSPEGIELAGIQLRPDWQSRGIGSRIIMDLVTEAASRATTTTLSVEKDNPRAAALYRRLGFMATGETDTEITMTKPN